MDSGFPRSESHERWANYFFKEIWNDPNLPEKVKWTNIAIAYVNQSKKQNKMKENRIENKEKVNGKANIRTDIYLKDMSRRRVMK